MLHTSAHRFRGAPLNVQGRGQISECGFLVQVQQTGVEFKGVLVVITIAVESETIMATDSVLVAIQLLSKSIPSLSWEQQRRAAKHFSCVENWAVPMTKRSGNARTIDKPPCQALAW